MCRVTFGSNHDFRHTARIPGPVNLDRVSVFLLKVDKRWLPLRVSSKRFAGFENEHAQIRWSPPLEKPLSHLSGRVGSQDGLYAWELELPKLSSLTLTIAEG
jgi:hypothetical protein